MKSYFLIIWLILNISEIYSDNILALNMSAYYEVRKYSSTFNCVGLSNTKKLNDKMSLYYGYKAFKLDFEEDLIFYGIPFSTFYVVENGFMFYVKELVHSYKNISQHIAPFLLLEPEKFVRKDVYYKNCGQIWTIYWVFGYNSTSIDVSAHVTVVSNQLIQLFVDYMSDPNIKYTISVSDSYIIYVGNRYGLDYYTMKTYSDFKFQRNPNANNSLGLLSVIELIPLMDNCQRYSFQHHKCPSQCIFCSAPNICSNGLDHFKTFWDQNKCNLENTVKVAMIVLLVIGLSSIVTVFLSVTVSHYKSSRSLYGRFIRRFCIRLRNPSLFCRNNNDNTQDYPREPNPREINAISLSIYNRSNNVTCN